MNEDVESIHIYLKPRGGATNVVAHTVRFENGKFSTKVMTSKSSLRNVLTNILNSLDREDTPQDETIH